ncbi:hypothetical protein Q8A67_015023 [Cirrhinus molitorella]|uniref:Uncharacterized protein n=1 Tax=Cirrhinus molitorella TaxID=172907 RepID=A0AA88TUV1_9TELE|nr:hypothetical protein Q8A67_015023 [Cirrhinus molitorella]
MTGSEVGEREWGRVGKGPRAGIRTRDARSATALWWDNDVTPNGTEKEVRQSAIGVSQLCFASEPLSLQGIHAKPAGSVIRRLPIGQKLSSASVMVCWSHRLKA